MAHSIVTAEGQTTLPDEVRQALNIRPGDRLQYVVEGNRVIVRVHPGLHSLRGALTSDKGKNMTFAEIREAAAQAHLAERGGKYE